MVRFNQEEDMSALKWQLTQAEQQKFLAALTDVLAPLRAKVGISQSELAGLVGLTRQTISMVESRRRPMSWSTYLSLILFFDYNQATHQMIRDVGAFPDELVERFNSGARSQGCNMLRFERSAGEITQMLEALDSKGVKALDRMLLSEYGRCTAKTL